MELIASKEVCAIFAGLMSEGIDYGCLEVREVEDDIDFICDNDPEPNVPTWEQVVNDRSAVNGLDTLLDLQERMQKGMGFIQQATCERDAALNEYIAHKEQFQQLMEKLNVWTEKFSQLSDNEKHAKGRNFYQWKSALWEKANPIKDQRNVKYEEYRACCDKLSKYWERWNALRDEAQAMSGYTWRAYYELLDEDLNKYWSNADSDEIDSQISLHETDYSDQLAYSHIQEMKAYDKEIFVNWDFHDERLNQRLLNEYLDMESLMESAPF